MNISIKNFIKQEKEANRRENMKVLNLRQQISEYETVIDVVSQTDSYRTIEIYREKIDRCMDRINEHLDNIRQRENRIATMRKVDKIIARGVNKVA